MSSKSSGSKSEDSFSMQKLSDHIRTIIISRSKVESLLNSAKFEELMKGCFVRYHSENSTSNMTYIIAQVIGVIEGPK